ncbi:MAG: phasin family protein [Gammaproteobacteria bacterium]
MQQPSIEQMNEFCSKASAAMKDYEQINTRFWKKCTEQQLQFLRLCTEFGQREFELWTNGKDLPALTASQAQIAREWVTKMNERCSEGFASLRDTSAEVMALVDPGTGGWMPAPVAEGAAPPPADSLVGTLKVKRAHAA